MIQDTYILRLCTVLNVQDDADGLRIKVRLDYEDNDVEDKDLPYCFPLLPKLLHVNPRVGELVFVILQSQGQVKGNRFFIGPIISQPYYINKDFAPQAQSLLQGIQNKQPLPHPKTNPLNDGTLPDREDVAIQGRQNGDIIFKPNQVLLRCGFKKNPLGSAENTLIFNDKDLAYIQLKYGNFNDKTSNFNSIVNVVADRINLLSHDSPTSFKLGDSKDLITDEEMDNILNNAHPLVYGDNLVKFLQDLVNIFLTHEHPWAQLPPTVTDQISKLLKNTNTLSKDILSKSIKIN